MNWRFCDSRGGNYVVKMAEENGSILGYIILRINKIREDYPIGYIVDLLTLPERLDVVSDLISNSVNYFDVNDVNAINLFVSGSYTAPTYVPNTPVLRPFP